MGREILDGWEGREIIPVTRIPAGPGSETDPEIPAPAAGGSDPVGTESPPPSQPPSLLPLPQVKGKGELETYWVGTASQAAVAAAIAAAAMEASATTVTATLVMAAAATSTEEADRAADGISEV